MRGWSVAALIAIAWTLAGCATDPDLEQMSGVRTEPQPMFSVDGKGAREQTYPIEAVLGRSPAAAQKSAMIAAIHAIDDEASVTRRNAAVGDLVLASEANCQVYLSALRGGQVTARVTVDTLTNLTAGAAAISRPTSSAQLLAAFASFFNATGSSIDRNIFAQEGAEVITAEIETLRAQKLSQIRSSLAGDYASYPIAFALRDVVEYHGDCSVRKALGSLPATVAQREAAIKAIRIAAGTALETNGSSPTVTRIIAGLADNTGVAAATPSPPPAPSDLTGDFAAFQRDSIACVGAIKQAALAPLPGIEKGKADLTDAKAALADPLTSKSTSACAKKSNPWRDRFFDAIASQSKASAPQAQQAYDNLTAAVAAAKGDSKQLAAADAAAKAAMDDIFASLQDSILTTIRVEQERSGHDRREALRLANKASGAADATAAAVAATLDLTSASHHANGDAKSTVDPMLQMVADAMASVKGNPALGEHAGGMAAGAAANAAAAYDQAYRSASG